MIQMLKNNFHLFVIAKECGYLDGITTFSYPADKSSKERTKQEQDSIILKCKQKDFQSLIFTPNRLQIKKHLKEIGNIHLFIVEDITLLPFATAYKKTFPNTKILIDLREYYPLEYEHDKEWLESFGAFFFHLCATYLPHVDLALTVSTGIAQKYQEVFHLSCELFYSLPPYFPLQPSNIHPEKIQIVYHGFLSPDRNSHFLLEIAKHLDKRFHLYVLGLSNIKGFLESLQQHAPKNLSFLPPVAMQDIIPFTQQFDLGILTLTPNSFNNAHAMPNKFFEYIQARLGIITTPIPSITSFLSKYNLGVYSKDFHPHSLIDSINALCPKEIETFKNNAHQASMILNTKQNQEKILSLVNRIL